MSRPGEAHKVRALALFALDMAAIGINEVIDRVTVLLNH